MWGRQQTGSSPHTRGARRHRLPHPSGVWIIPAYAGSTHPTLSTPHRRRDHPRIRGEHISGAGAVIGAVGSSPHTRGARRRRRQSSLGRRIIPAYAGSTMLLPIVTKVTGDHPRIRGEHGSTARIRGFRVGSSPHTRGALAGFDVPVDLTGIIPAYAGSTPGDAGTPGRAADHPRIRGEHDVYDMVTARGRGSSPHTRGALSPSFSRGMDMRIIPAYAGSTSSYPTCELPRTDHPRIRGEHTSRVCASERGPGSSPHTRGAPQPYQTGNAQRGIIPAYAGSTPLTDLKSVGGGDHPRIRGEHGSTPSTPEESMGSSPHTRGARTELPQNIVDRRIIPAYAGSTQPPAPSFGRGPDHPRIRGEHSRPAPFE